MSQNTLAKKEIRKLVISLAKRRQRPGTGSALAFLRQRTTMVDWPNLSVILHPMPWAVTGGVATRLYMPERVTQDLDIIIRQEDDTEARQRLAKAGFKYQGELSIGGSQWLSPDQTRVEVIESSEPWLELSLQEARDNLDAQGLPVLPLPYLVLLKFRAGRVQDLADVTRMLGQADEKSLEGVRRLFSRFAPDDMEDLESLITLGQLEMKEDSSK
ncbi:MAG: hypothetical protein HY673_04955 [Chloroflexi bacterium]|nr:hypothetical protein [Chloroflexota bacterium]